MLETQLCQLKRCPFIGEVPKEGNKLYVEGTMPTAPRFLRLLPFHLGVIGVVCVYTSMCVSVHARTCASLWVLVLKRCFLGIQQNGSVLLAYSVIIFMIVH